MDDTVTLTLFKESGRLGPDSEDLWGRRAIYVVVQFVRFDLCQCLQLVKFL